MTPLREACALVAVALASTGAGHWLHLTHHYAPWLFGIAGAALALAAVCAVEHWHDTITAEDTPSLPPEHPQRRPKHR